jgi:D-alanyl-D-alanine dipeptidase
MALKSGPITPSSRMVSVESVVARVGELRAVLDPVPVAAPVAAPAPAPAASFATRLRAAAAPAATAPGAYPHLTGDLDAAPELLARLEALAARRGETLHVTSGLRTHAEQQALWDARATNPFPVARPGASLHHAGRAADVTIGGRPIQDVVPAGELAAAGLRPLAGDAVHVELPG